MKENRKRQTAEDRFRYMTETPVKRLIGHLALPAVISMLITSLYNMADTFFIGRLDNTSATAAIGVTFPLMAIIQAFGFTMGHGSGNSMSRSLGRRETESAGKMAATGFVSSLIIGAVISAGGLMFLKPLMFLMGATETILPYAEEYARYILIGAPWMMAAIVLNNQLRLQGSASFAMVGIMSGSILNIGLDPLLIYVFDMGVAGAALATIISQFASLLLLLWGTRLGGNIRIVIRKFTPTLAYYIEILKGGMPSLWRQGLASAASILLNQAAKQYGGTTTPQMDAAVAAMSIVSRVMMFCASAAIGFGQGFQPVCAFNYGAKRYGRIREAFRFSLGVMFAGMTAAAAVGFIFPSSVIGLFSSDAAVISFGRMALRCQCAVFPLLAIVFLTNMMLQSMGIAGRASLTAMARQGLFFIPAILLLPLLLGALGVQIAQAAADACSIIFCLFMVVPVLRKLKDPSSGILKGTSVTSCADN